MTCNWKVRLLIATTLVVVWATAAEACCWRRSCSYNSCGYGGYGGGYGYSSCGYGSPTGYYASQQGYVTDGGYYGGYYGGGYPGMYGGGYGGYGYGGYGYNPGGLGGPYSGLGVRPGLGFGGLGRGR
jgi:hypothetical protein